jgi:TM2 domain-containing membrane protein YozV
MSSSNSPPKSKIVAALLCFFLGALGVHRFYLGYTKLGIFQIITCGGCGIWALIDFIQILTGGLKDSEGRDLQDS